MKLYGEQESVEQMFQYRAQDTGGWAGGQPDPQVSCVSRLGAEGAGSWLTEQDEIAESSEAPLWNWYFVL